MTTKVGAKLLAEGFAALKDDGEGGAVLAEGFAALNDAIMDMWGSKSLEELPWAELNRLLAALSDDER